MARERQALITGLAAAALTLAGAPPAAAHLGAQAYLFVAADYVLQGTTFSVVVSDVSPNATVAFELNADGYSAPIGSVTAGQDGHFQTTLTMPADAPTGYVELAASSPDGTRVATWVRAGPPSANAGPPPSLTASGGGIDPSVIVLIVLLGGAIGGVGYLLLRRKQPAIVAGQSTDARESPRLRSKSGRRGTKH